MKKKILVLFTFLFFIFPTFNINAAVPSQIPTLPSAPSGYDKYVLRYCDGVCSSSYNNKFYVIYYNNFSSSSNLIRFDDCQVYVYNDNAWVEGISGSASFSVSEGIYFAKTNDPEIKEKFSDFFLDSMMVRVVEDLPLEEALKVVVEITPIVVLSIVSYLGLRKAFHWLLLQLKGC